MTPPDSPPSSNKSARLPGTPPSVPSSPEGGRLASNRSMGAADSARPAGDSLPSTLGKGTSGGSPSELPPELPPEDAPSGGRLPYEPGDLTFDLEIRRRIEQVTRSRELLQEQEMGSVLNAFYERKGWVSVLEGDPFARLFLDYRQCDEHMDELVPAHFAALRAFWKAEGNRLDADAEKGGDLKRRYGGSAKVDSYVEDIEEAKEALYSAEGRRDFFEKLFEAAQIWLTSEVARSLRDGVLDEVAELMRDGAIRGLSEDEVAEALDAKMQQSVPKFEPEATPQGRTLAERLGSTTWKRIGATPPINIEIGGKTARMFPRLVALCDELPAEAMVALYNGGLASALAAQGQMTLSGKAKGVVVQESQRKDRGLERFVRALAEHAESSSVPILLAEEVDLGTAPIGALGPNGAPRQHSLELSVSGRPRAWGTIRVEGDLPGLSVPGVFEVPGPEPPPSIELDTLRVKPGTYEGELILKPEGGDTLRVPVRYIVSPVTLVFDPPEVDLGRIRFGKEKGARVRVACDPPEGRFEGTVSLSTPLVGVQTASDLKPDGGFVGVTVGTAALKGSQAYQTQLLLDTTLREFRVPVRFRVGINTARVAKWVGGLTGAVLLIALLASLIGPGDDPSPTARVMTEQLNVRSEPTAAGGSETGVGRLYRGNEVEILGYTENEEGDQWLRIRYQGASRWISGGSEYVMRLYAADIPYIAYNIVAEPSPLPPDPPLPPEPEVFEVVERMPELIGGLQGLQARISYPEAARRAGIEGRVFVQFVVNEQGRPTDVRVVRGIGGGCDEVATRALRESRFTPGLQRGRPVKVRMSLPVTFRLPDEPEPEPSPPPEPQPPPTPMPPPCDAEELQREVNVLTQFVCPAKTDRASRATCEAEIQRREAEIQTCTR